MLEAFKKLYNLFIRFFNRACLLWQPLTKIVNNALSNLIPQKFYRNHKRTWQEVPNIFLHYIYTNTWFVIRINNPTLMSICQPCIKIANNEFCFSFLFYFLFSILETKIRIRVMSYITATNCHIITYHERK